MWTLSVNDILEANMHGLLKLYNQYARIDKSKNIKHKSVAHMFANDAKGSLNLSLR